MNLAPATLLNASLCGYAMGVLGGLLLLKRDRLANVFCFGATALAALSGLSAALLSLAAGAGGAAPHSMLFRGPLSWLQVSVRLDPLSALFLLLVSLLSLAIATYSLGYMRGYFGRKNIGTMGALFNALALATTIVVVADNIWLFLVGWEIMAFTAFCLVCCEHEKAETRSAGVLYFIMSHIDAVCITLGFLLLYQASGDFGFASLHDIGAKMSPGHRDAAFLLLLTGFGIKAGIVPLHIWLPAAHPVAPSNVSAFMSGVLIKMGIYGFARVAFDFLGA
ncbi:MAG: proton-conducting transporter membrane subunit, partial [Opitutaceae bacterium]